MKDLIQYAAILIVILVVTLIFLSFQLPDIGPAHRFVYHQHKNNKNLHQSYHLYEKYDSTTTGSTNEDKNNKKHRLAVLLPFIGKSAADIPPYLDLFCLGASGSAAIADFIIVHNGVLADYDSSSSSNTNPNNNDKRNKQHQQQQYPHPPRPCHVATNVFFYNLNNTTNMARLLLKVLDEKINNSLHAEEEEEEDEDASSAEDQRYQLAIPYHHLLQLLTMHLDRYPYILVEFKPALGYILHDYLLMVDDDDDDDDDEKTDDSEETDHVDKPRQYKYTHWAYSDLDILWGDLNRHLEPSEWNDYHVVTFSFGDQQRLYARGQFTMHKLPQRPPLLPKQSAEQQLVPASNFMVDLEKDDDSSLLTLWKPCPYLTHLDVRFADIVQQWKEQQEHPGSKEQDNNKPLFQLESAEGCYSVALLHNEDISVKFAVKAWTDEHHAQELPHTAKTRTKSVDTIPTHGLYVSRDTRPGAGKDHDEHAMVVVLSKPTTPAAAAATTMATTSSTSTMTSWWRDDPVYSDANLTLQQTMGAMEPLPLPTSDTTGSHNSKNKRCMYWVQQQYQPFLCLQQNEEQDMVVTATDNVFWVKGQLYKQSFQNRPLKNGTMLTAPFFHFQEWKRSFRFNQLASASLTETRQDKKTKMSLALADFLLGPEGVMPLDFHHPSTATARRIRLGGGGSSASSSSTFEVPSPLGIPAHEWNHGTTTTATASEEQDNNDRSQLPWYSYCLSFEAPDRFAAKCRFIASWQDAESVDVVSWAPAWQKMSVDAINDDVTLVLTWQIDLPKQQENSHWQDFFESVVISNLQKWQGQPSVLVIALIAADDATDDASSSTTQEALSFLRERLSTGPENNGTGILESSLVAIVIVPPPDPTDDRDDLDRMALSRKALLNMALDCVPTRWHLTGLDMEQGLILSTQAVVFAHRAAETHGKLQHPGGNIFWLPQFGLATESKTAESSEVTMRMTLPQLMVARQKDQIKPLAFFDTSCASFSSDSSSSSSGTGSGLDNLWWTQTAALVDPIGGAGGNKVDGLGRLAAALQEEEANFLSLLTLEKFDLLLEEGLFSSPLLLIDNLGPQSSMLTHLMARHVEEFVGDHCFNPLHLAQLLALGYRLNVLEGAFALSTDSSRKLSATATTPKSRCNDGCLLFDSRHDDLLQSIAHEEIARPAKTGVLRSEMTDTS